MKKWGSLLLGASLLSAGTAQAYWENNWLVGVSGGYAWRHGDLEIEGTDSRIFPARIFLNSDPTVDLDRTFRDNGGVYALFAGYQSECNRWLWGIELNVEGSDVDNIHEDTFLDSDNATWTSAVRFDRDFTVGLSARFGYWVTSFLMPYIRGGVETSRDKLLFHVNSPDRNFFDPDSIEESAHHYNYRWFAGFGIELPLHMWRSASLRLEYDQHGKSSRVRAEGESFDRLVEASASARTRVHSAIASLVWNFY